MDNLKHRRYPSTKRRFTTRGDIKRQAIRFAAYYDKVDDLVRRRYFPDPIAWQAIDALDAESYEQVLGYARLCLACELQGKPALQSKTFTQIDPQIIGDMMTNACRVIVRTGRQV